MATITTSGPLDEPVPSKVVYVVVGMVDYTFMNVVDPKNPTRLTLDLQERCELVFTLSDDLIKAGWTFQDRPITIAFDYGVNFSSYVWVPYGPEEAKPVTHSRFKIIYECKRMGVYDYSLLMRDKFGQNIDLDPDVDNGAGQIP
ncbi:hypothetical protein [Caulobacter sp. RHG1]|jgi:hypothetical protein|uniref:hypothetical protein n=1 Tax=Caulobacter sp. (strain RHG1) TaxID=2545762 RepID=UPI001F506F53|nr:hypothetical protein [Caulobacter sp. RHG1]NQE61249.1 hypothetical protein [Caulobacter sp. RHG1]